MKGGAAVAGHGGEYRKFVVCGEMYWCGSNPALCAPEALIVMVRYMLHFLI